MITELISTVKNFTVSTTQLRWFGVFIGILFVLARVFWFDTIVLVVLAVASFVGAVFTPRWFLPMVLVLIAITFPLGWVISRALLVVLYLLVLTPIGIIRRLLGRGDWKLDPTAASYWRPVEQNRHHDRMSL